ncbi:hypothetical protein MMC13_000093 [Lambiella insularis]|nr:hypothetical protein [Lambiella insularis]
MDSMRSLNKSLPSSPPKHPSTPRPEQLLQAFKTAALSVTNLYKTAALDQKQARQMGYQDSLDELLTFLDKESLGLGDGEGWRVRQWATERLDGTPPAQAGSESDDDRVEAEKGNRSRSPVLQPKSAPDVTKPRPMSRSRSPARMESTTTPPLPVSLSQHTVAHSTPETFTFRAVPQLPQDIDMQSVDTTTHPEPTEDSPNAASSQSVRVEFLPRATRQHRHSSLASRHNTRSTTSIRPLGTGAGSKRRIAFGDFFDIGNLGDGKDGGGGPGKRSRMN